MLDEIIKKRPQKKSVTAFTPRELQCIAQAADGKNLPDIAECLKISQCSVYFYLVNIRRKFDLLTESITVCKPKTSGSLFEGK